MNDEIPPEPTGENGPVLLQQSLAGRLFSLQQEHRDLDSAIDALHQQQYRDQLLLQRLKKKKLRLKDLIIRLKRDVIPDLNA